MYEKRGFFLIDCVWSSFRASSMPMVPWRSTRCVCRGVRVIRIRVQETGVENEEGMYPQLHAYGTNECHSTD